MKHFFTIFGAGFAAFYGIIIAMIVGGGVGLATNDFLPGLRLLEGVIGGLSGAITGGCYAHLGKHHKRYGFGLFTRVGLAGSGLPLIRLGLYQSHWPTALIFLLLGSSLLLIGGFLIFQVVCQIPAVNQRLSGPAALVDRVTQTGGIGLLLYGSLGVALILFGAYEAGRVELGCRRLESGRVDCILAETRWLDFVTVRETMMQGLQSVHSEFQTTIFITESGEVTLNDSGSRVYYVVADFLNTTRPSLTVRTDAEGGFFGFCLMAAFLTWVGLGTDPDMVRTTTKEDKRTKQLIHAFESPLLIWGLTLGLCSLGIFRLVIPDLQAQIVEEKSLQILTSPARLTDIQEGAVVLAEGHLSENNETIFRDFVIYQTERYGDDSWHTYQRELPSFWLDLRGTMPVSERRLWVTNGKYGLESTVLPREWRPDEDVGGERVRYRGLGRGDLVTVYGQVEAVNGEPQFTAWVLYGGRTIEDYRQGSHTGLTNLRWVGGGLAAVGGMFVLIFVGKHLSGLWPGEKRQRGN